MLHQWAVADASGKKLEDGGRLLFENGGCLLTADPSGTKVLLRGTCFCDDQTLTVLSEDCGTVQMSYRLSENTLALTFSGRTAYFIKI